MLSILEQNMWRGRLLAGGGPGYKTIHPKPKKKPKKEESPVKKENNPSTPLPDTSQVPKPKH